MTILMWICLFVFGAFISRCCGASWSKFPIRIEPLVFGFVYFLLPCSHLLAFLSVLGAWAGKASGHGQYFNLSAPRSQCPPENDEWYDFMLIPFFGKDTGNKNRYWRNFAGMAISGLFPALFASLAMFYSQGIISGLVILFSGLAKAPIYALCEKTKYQTELAEYITGGILWASVGAIL